MAGQVLHHLAEASAKKWEVIGDAAKDKDWGHTLKLILIILALDSPLIVAIVLAMVLR